MTHDEQPEEVIIITRQIWRLKILRQILVLVVSVLALVVMFSTEVIVWRYANAKDAAATTAQEAAQEASKKADTLQATIDRQSTVAACRNKISGDWVNALDLMLKRQAQSIVIVITNPLDRAALDGKRAELDQAINLLDVADDKRFRQDEICGK